MIYFDNAATTYPKPLEIKNALIESLDKYSFNAGRGYYDASEETTNMILETRGKLAKFVNLNANNVVFTSSATESLNMIINGLNLTKGDNVIVSYYEHNAVIRPLYNLGINIIKVKNDSNFEQIFENNQIKAVFISHVSNVLGTIFDYRTLFEIAKLNNAITVLDAAQSFGTIEIDKNNVDYIVFAGHKCFYTPIGIAGFIVNTKHKLSIYKSGGTGSDSLNHEMPNELPYRYESGSLPANLIYTLNKGIDFINSHSVKEHKEELTNYLVNELKVLENVILYNNDYSYGIVSFNVKGYTASEVSQALNDNFSICTRCGYHCAPFISDLCDIKQFAGTVRVSFSFFNTKEEIDYLIDCLKEF